MMKQIAFLLILSCYVAQGCAPTNKLSEQKHNDGTDLSGDWVYSSGNEFELVLSVGKKANDREVHVLGEHFETITYEQEKNQTLMKVKNIEGDTLHILTQLDQFGLMRMSITSDEVTHFMPIGQLGERVYRLSRVDINRVMVSSTLQPKSKVKKH